MCPLVKALEREAKIHSIVCTTGQHREMLSQALEMFAVRADHSLDIMQPGQTLTDVTARVLYGMQHVLEAEKPDLLLVHGDTTTTFSAALAAFYAHIPVGHVEAGLRTESIRSPFPEELNRRLTARIASLHFAPTKRCERNLLSEGIAQNVFVTGNTAIDALRYTVDDGYSFASEALRQIDFSGRVVTVTAHRRENWGEPMANICRAVLALARMHPQIQFVFPMHLNPIVRNVVTPLLGGHPRILLIEPLGVKDMHNLMKRSFLVLTDSGGIQEEAPALGTPVVVLRKETERGEAVESGTVALAGTDETDIIQCADKLLSDAAVYMRMKEAVSPYGDGYASEKIVKHILRYFEG